MGRVSVECIHAVTSRSSYKHSLNVDLVFVTYLSLELFPIWIWGESLPSNKIKTRHSSNAC